MASQKGTALNLYSVKCDLCGTDNLINLASMLNTSGIQLFRCLLDYSLKKLFEILRDRLEESIDRFKGYLLKHKINLCFTFYFNQRDSFKRFFK